jgi:thiamine biosynthesis lipoprotein
MREGEAGAAMDGCRPGLSKFEGAAKGLLAAALAAALVWGLASCAPAKPQKRSAVIFTSNIALTLNDHASEPTFEACFSRLREIDARMNMWEPDSELARLNARAGNGPVAVSADLLAVAKRGLELARLTDGIFDPSVAPLVKLWGVATDHPRVPSEAEIAAALAHVGWRRVRLDEAAGTIDLPEGMGLDFGALAKGYGAMEGGKVLARLGVRSALLDVGGCVLTMGTSPSGRPWHIGVQDPGRSRGSPLGYFAGRDFAVDTSGVYERYFESGGKRYAHIMDTRTGRPADAGILSATVALPRGENSDGPPLALLVLGPSGGIALADRLGLAAVLIGTDRSIYLSQAAKASFTLLDRSFVIR